MTIAEHERQAAAVQYRLATIWQSKGRVERAIAGYEEAIRLRPDFIPAHLELCRLLAREGRADAAAEAYRRAHALNSHEAVFEEELTRLTRGQAARVDGDETDAAPGRASGAHVMLYTECSGLGGVEQCNHALLMALLREGYRVTCVQPRARNHLLAEQRRLGVRHLWLEDDSDLYDLARPARALTEREEPRHILRNARPDLIIFGEGAPMSNLAAKDVARAEGFPYIVIEHCAAREWSEQYAPYLGPLPEIYRGAVAVVAVSQATLDLLHERFGLPDDAGRVIYPGRARRFFAPPAAESRAETRQSLGIPPDAVAICTIASMELRKGYQILLRALKDLVADSDLYFLWMGSGTLEPQLRAAVDALDAGDRVRFLRERDDVRRILDAADMFVLTSYFEGMPGVVIEAMARGLPVAATGVSGVPEELGDTGNVLPDPTLAPEATVDELVATIRAWAASEELRRAVGRAGRRRADLMFREEHMTGAQVDLVRQVLARGVAVQR